MKYVYIIMDTTISIFGIKLRLEIIVIFVIICILIFTQSCFSCSSILGYNVGGSLGYSKFEGFTSFPGTGGGPAPNNYQVDSKSWGVPDLTVVPGQPLSPGVQEIMNRKPQPVPLPSGELFMFETTPFKPECCSGSSYTNSEGCACMTPDQYNYLIERGGNNKPYSEY